MRRWQPTTIILLFVLAPQVQAFGRMGTWAQNARRDVHGWMQNAGEDVDNFRSDVTDGWNRFRGGARGWMQDAGTWMQGAGSWMQQNAGPVSDWLGQNAGPVMETTLDALPDLMDALRACMPVMRQSCGWEVMLKPQELAVCATNLLQRGQLPQQCVDNLLEAYDSLSPVLSTFGIDLQDVLGLPSFNAPVGGPITTNGPSSIPSFTFTDDPITTSGIPNPPQPPVPMPGLGPDMSLGDIDLDDLMSSISPQQTNALISSCGAFIFGNCAASLGDMQQMLKCGLEALNEGRLPVQCKAAVEDVVGSGTIQLTTLATTAPTPAPTPVKYQLRNSNSAFGQRMRDRLSRGNWFGFGR